MSKREFLTQSNRNTRRQRWERRGEDREIGREGGGERERGREREGGRDGKEPITAKTGAYKNQNSAFQSRHTDR